MASNNNSAVSAAGAGAGTAASTIAVAPGAAAASTIAVDPTTNAPIKKTFKSSATIGGMLGSTYYSEKPASQLNTVDKNTIGPIYNKPSIFYNEYKIVNVDDDLFSKLNTQFKDLTTPKEATIGQSGGKRRKSKKSKGSKRSTSSKKSKRSKSAKKSKK